MDALTILRYLYRPFFILYRRARLFEKNFNVNLSKPFIIPNPTAYKLHHGGHCRKMTNSSGLLVHYRKRSTPSTTMSSILAKDPMER
jgi:hypothetical protein